MPTRHASATWTGDLRSGKGSFTSESGAVGGDFSFGTRFGDVAGTNPEELLAAADAACFSMALSGALAKAGMTPEKIETKAACTIEKVGDGFTITKMQLDVRAQVPNLDDATFQQIAAATKEGCPVSRALKGNVDIQLTATLA